MAALDGYHEHEALDRLHIVCSMIDDHLLDHPYIQSRPDLLRRVSEASKSLADAYCLVGVPPGGRD